MDLIADVRSKAHAYAWRPKGERAEKGQQSKWRKEGERRKRRYIAAILKLSRFADEKVLKVAQTMPWLGLRESRRLSDKTIVFSMAKKEWVVGRITKPGCAVTLDHWAILKNWQVFDFKPEEMGFCLMEAKVPIRFTNQKHINRGCYLTNIYGNRSYHLVPAHQLQFSEVALEAIRLALFYSEELRHLPRDIKKKIWHMLTL